MGARIISPLTWLARALASRPALQGLTTWFSGDTHPEHPGWYERYFTDSELIGDATMNWWDGTQWRKSPTGPVHWRQVGDYPAWRGLLAPYDAVSLL